MQQELHDSLRCSDQVYTGLDRRKLTSDVEESIGMVLVFGNGYVFRGRIAYSITLLPGMILYNLCV